MTRIFLFYYITSPLRFILNLLFYFCFQPQAGETAGDVVFYLEGNQNITSVTVVFSDADNSGAVKYLGSEGCVKGL